MARPKQISKKPRARWSLAEYAAFARERGGQLLTPGSRDQVPRVHERLRFRCSHGHEWSPQANAIKNCGYWCFRCARGGDVTWTIADYRKHAIDHGGHLLDRRPDNFRPLSTERIRFRCDKGHTWDTVAYSVKRDRPWCRTCTRTDDPWDISHYRAYAKERGGRLRSRHPSGVIEHKVAMTFRCAKGHEWTTTAGQIKIDHTWCGKCGYDGRRKSINDLYAIAAERGGKLIAPGRNRAHKFEWECARGHTFALMPAEAKRGLWCSRCSASLSERLVRAHFEQIFRKPFPRMRPAWLRNTTGHTLELDGFCEELGIAFEHQGGQHYRKVELFSNHTLHAIRTRDARKRRVCRLHNVALIEIPELFKQLPVSELQRFILDACKQAGVRFPRGAASTKVKMSAVYSTTRDDEALIALQSIAKQRGGRCLADDYAGWASRANFECAAGHQWSARLGDVFSGTWCKKCAMKTIADRKRLTIKMMQGLAARRGGKCLSQSYVDANTKLRWRCGACGHEWEAAPQSIQRGTWCAPCGWKAGWKRRRLRFGQDGGNKGTLKYTIADLRRLAQQRGGKCLSRQFVGVSKHHRWQCGKCGNEWLAAPTDIFRGTWCPPCSRRQRWDRFRAARKAGKS